MLPADERFHADNAIAAELDLRLIMQPEFVAAQRPAQFVSQLDLLAHLDVELLGMEAILVAPLLLGAVERDIGLRQQILRGLGFGVVDGDADAGGHVQGIAVNLIGLGQGIADFLGQRPGIGALGQFALQDRKLVTAQATNQIGIANALLDALAHFDQETVADRMTQRIIDVLEAVEIDIVQGKARRAAAGSNERLPEPVDKGRAVGQAGQRIGAGEQRNLLLGDFALGDIDQ